MLLTTVVVAFCLSAVCLCGLDLENISTFLSEMNGKCANLQEQGAVILLSFYAQFK